MKVLITGVAGFIGSRVARKFIEEGHKVIGIDNLSGMEILKIFPMKLIFITLI